MKELLISTHVPEKNKINPGPAERPETTNKRAQTTDLRPVQKKCLTKQLFLNFVFQTILENISQRPKTRDQRPEYWETRDHKQETAD